jgi:Flp pilus assembly protein TadD
MTYAQILAARPRRRMALALLASTAAAALLGGCNQMSLPFSKSAESKLGATDSIGAIAQWSSAYAKNPEDPKIALGYAAALKSIGSRDKALEVLTASYRGDPTNGEVAAELGRLALDMGRPEIAAQTLQVAEERGIRDWKTLSAQGTLRAKQGRHAEAQQYFLAALKEQPDAVSVINNLALSYALDGKAGKAEELLKKAAASGQDDKRVRQNLALVLGLQGKFDEARKVASLDMSDQDAKANTTYLRNMLSSPTQFADANDGSAGGDDWQPFGSAGAPSNKVAAAPAQKPAMQVVQTTEQIEAPSAAKSGNAAQASAPATSSQAKSTKVAGTPTLITPANVTPAPGDIAGMLRN